MATLENDFQAWRASSSSSNLEFLRVEDGAAVLRVSRASGEHVANVSLMPVEGASFFIEGLDDPPEQVEDWLTDVNGLLSDEPKYTLAQALDALVRRAPKSMGLVAQDVEMSQDDEEPDMEDDDDDDVFQDNAPAAVEVQAGYAREAQRNQQIEDEQWTAMANSQASRGSRQASQVLMREMRTLLALQAGEGDGKALEIDMVEDSLYHWSVKMHASGFPQSQLRTELERFGQQHPSGLPAVVMEVLFPDTYPMAPPFIRVIRPRFQMHSGHVTIGGSICMQLLTPSGWLPSVSLENVFVSIRSEMVEGNGRLDFSNNRDYTKEEAKEAFNRVASRYGWLKT